VAASARALAASARKGGYAVAAVDYFCDTDLAALTTACERIPRDSQGRVDADGLLGAAARLAPAGCHPEWGLVYGSGFEDRPELLQRLALGRRLFGNSPQVLTRAKDPVQLAALLDGLGIPHPEVRLEPPAPGEARAWLRKRIGGAGGVHIREAGTGPQGSAVESGSFYYQRRVEGRTVAALLLADGRTARALGLSLQWACPGSPDRPFRFGGAVAPVAFPEALGRRLAGAAVAVAESLGLVGLNGVDFVVPEEDGGFSLIEVNPRPVAAAGIFDRFGGPSLFDLHVRAAAGALPPLPAGGWFPPDAAFASAVVYADEAIVMSQDFAWPSWSADRPAAGTRVGPGEPICTVFAEARGPAADARAEEARALVLRRAEALRATIKGCMQSFSARPGRSSVAASRAQGPNERECDS
jgi:predicted ATP-grasp superfamily ATP-dependent carboligase